MLARALRHRAAIGDAAAERVVPLPFGTALFHSAVPRVHDLNLVRVERADGDLSAREVAATVDRLYAGTDVPHRRFETWDEATGERLLPELEAAGWEADRIALMVAPAGLAPAASAAEEVHPDVVRHLRREWVASTPPFDADPGLLEQVLAADRILAAGLRTRAFCAFAGGRAAAMALLIGDGPEQMIEDVYTAPAMRGQGLGAAVVRAAAGAARDGGADLVFLPTDADGLAQLFYRRLGFEAIGVVTRFVT